MNTQNNYSNQNNTIEQNTKKLKVGQEFKNYKELCEFLGEKIKSSNSKKKQINDWMRCFEFKKEKQAYKIIKVYENPQAITYTEKIELLLLNMMSQSEHSNYTIFAPKTTILEKLNIINDNYRYFYQHEKGLAKHTNIDENLVYDFLKSVNSSTKHQLEKVLKKLTNKCLIQYTVVPMVCCNELLNNSYQLVYRKATTEEIEYSLKIKKNVMTEMGFNDERNIIASGLYSTYMKKINKMFKEKSKYNFFYKAYEIVFHKKHINQEFDKLLIKYKLDEDIQEGLLSETNCEHMETIINNAKQRQQSAVKEKDKYKVDTLSLDVLKHTWSKEELSKLMNVSKYSLDMCLLRSDENYVNNIKILADLLINRDTKSLYKLYET